MNGFIILGIVLLAISIVYGTAYFTKLHTIKTRDDIYTALMAFTTLVFILGIVFLAVGIKINNDKKRERNKN